MKPRNSKALKQIPKDQENTLRSSSNPPSKVKPQRPLKNFHQLKIKPRRPLEESVHHPFILRSSPNGPLDQQPQQIHTSNRSSRLSPKALEDPLIHQPSRSSPKALEEIHTPILQDQAQRPLKICSSTVHPWIKPRRPFGSTTHPQTYTLRR